MGIKHRIYIILYTSFLFIFSCDENINPNCSNVIQSASVVDFPMDLYGVNELEVIGDELHINITYGGGCEEHEFKLININSEIPFSGQDINTLYLSHNSNNDGCFGLILEHPICFDISDLNHDWLYFSHPDSIYDLN